MNKKGVTMKTLICKMSHTRLVYNTFMNKFEQKMLAISNIIF